jgi:hypothetical protein
MSDRWAAGPPKAVQPSRKKQVPTSRSRSEPTVVTPR